MLCLKMNILKMDCNSPPCSASEEQLTDKTGSTLIINLKFKRKDFKAGADLNFHFCGGSQKSRLAGSRAISKFLTEFSSMSSSRTSRLFTSELMVSLRPQ